MTPFAVNKRKNLRAYRVEQIEYDKTEFFSDVGGAAGLLLGISLTSLIGMLGNIKSKKLSSFSYPSLSTFLCLSLSLPTSSLLSYWLNEKSNTNLLHFKTFAYQFWSHLSKNAKSMSGWVVRQYFKRKTLGILGNNYCRKRCAHVSKWPNVLCLTQTTWKLALAVSDG